jgi:hypothetical protein
MYTICRTVGEEKDVKVLLWSKNLFISFTIELEWGRGKKQDNRAMVLGNILQVGVLLYPAWSRWEMYRGCCSRRDGAQTSG